MVKNRTQEQNQAGAQENKIKDISFRMDWIKPLEMGLSIKW